MCSNQNGKGELSLQRQLTPAVAAFFRRAMVPATSIRISIAAHSDLCRASADT